jgi:uncharacterized small protein (DUF1192 family)
MAETSKLSVGKVLDKLRSSDAPSKSKLTQLDENISEQDREIARLRAERLRLAASQQTGSPKKD